MGRNLTEKKADGYVQQLVEQVEKNGLIKAPFNMRDEIMKKVSIQKQITSQKSKSRKSAIQLIYYSMKVGIVAAMALIVLFSADYVRSVEVPGSQWQKMIVSQMNEKATQITNGLTSISNQILKMEVIKSEKEEK